MTPTSRRWYPPDVPAAVRHTTLTPLYADTLTSLALGLSNEQIARRLGVPVETVKSRCQALYRLLGARSRAHAVALVVSGAVDVTVRGQER